MNIFLLILQILLALHTLAGAAWKFGNSEQAVLSLKAIPHWVWLGMSCVEIPCAIALLFAAFYKPAAALAPIAALVIAVEMLLICVVHFSSGYPFNGQVIYWLVVAVVCGFLAYGRLALKPF